MKPKLTLAAGLFAMAAALSLNASAAADAPGGSETALDASADAKVEKAVHPMKMRSHSHVEEKTGVPQRTHEAMPDAPNAAKDPTRHFHPRDAK